MWPPFFFLTLTEPSLHSTRYDSVALNSDTLQRSVQAKSCTGNEGWIPQSACHPLSAPMHCWFLVLAAEKNSYFLRSDFFFFKLNWLLSPWKHIDFCLFAASVSSQTSMWVLSASPSMPAGFWEQHSSGPHLSLNQQEGNRRTSEIL